MQSLLILGYLDNQFAPGISCLCLSHAGMIGDAYICTF